MVEKTIIIKSINDAINKCKATDEIRRIGASAVVTNEDGYQTISYDNGMSVTFDLGSNGNSEEEYVLKNITTSEFSLDYLGEDSYDFFQNQMQWILDNYGEEEYERLIRYMCNLASGHGMELLYALRNNLMDLYPKGHYMSNEHYHFVDVMKSMPLPDESFMCLRVTNALHDNDGVNRRIIQDKGYFCTTCGSTMKELAQFADTIDGNPWKIITIVNPNDVVEGVFIGSAVKKGHCGVDWEKEYRFLPGQKFERDVIDERNHIIIQHPRYHKGEI
jgi:hypothetical protein